MNKYKLDYPIKLINQLKKVKGKSFEDEIRRDIDPEYLKRELQYSLLSYVDLKEFKGKRLLDFGCGSGSSTLNLSRFLPYTEIIGTDVDSQFLSIASQRLKHYKYENLKFYHTSALLENIEGDFDFVVMSAVHEHLTDEERDSIMPTIWEKLKFGGILFLNQTPFRWNLIENHTTNLPLINFLPSKLALFCSRKLSKRVIKDETWHSLLKRGIRGSTIREILLQLGKSEYILPEIKLLNPLSHKLKDRVDLWYKLSDPVGNSYSKKLYWHLNKLIIRYSRYEAVPYLNIAIKKEKLIKSSQYEYDLLVPSIVPVWENNGNYISPGGFPIQINALNNIFDKILIALPYKHKSPPGGLTKYNFKSITLTKLKTPPGAGLIRKLLIPFWFIIQFPKIFESIRISKSIYCPLPSDIGLLYLITCLLMKKKIFIRHCGTWKNKTTITDKFINWLLPKITNENVVVMATGSGKSLPEPLNHDIKWIFSTSLRRIDWKKINVAKTWSKGQTLKLIYVGRLSKDKNVSSIIEALKLFKKCSVNITLDIVGFGDQFSSLKSLALKLDLDNKINFHGAIVHKEVITQLSNSHILVFPTNTKEGFPKVVLEAMACGLPVIATKISAIPNLIEDKCGLLLKNTNSYSLYLAIKEMIKIPEKMVKMSEQGREISKNYLLENWVSVIKDRLEKNWGKL